MMVFFSLPENHPILNGLVQRGPITPINYPTDLIPYIKLNSNASIPQCPAGGTYADAAVGTNPTCTLSTLTPPHALQ